MFHKITMVSSFFKNFLVFGHDFTCDFDFVLYYESTDQNLSLSGIRKALESRRIDMNHEV